MSKSPVFLICSLAVAFVFAQSAPPVIKSALAQSTRSAQTQDLVFDVIGCRKQENQVTCHLLITNQAEDRPITLYSSNVKLYDDVGNVYDASSVRLGNQQGSGANLKAPLRIPIRSEIRFDKVDPAIKGIALLDILVIVPSGSFTVQIRDIAVAR